MSKISKISNNLQSKEKHCFWNKNKTIYGFIMFSKVWGPTDTKPIPRQCSLFLCFVLPCSVVAVIAKLSVHRFDLKSIAFIPAYLKNRKQKLGPLSGNIWIYYLVSHRNLLSGLLFLIFIGDLFYLNYDLDFASYADDTTPYICGQDFSSIINVLEPNANTLFNWLRQNDLIVNTGKSHFLTN